MSIPPRILISADVGRNLRAQYKDTRQRRERGGLLLGYRKGTDLEIIDATFPTKWDIATPFLFRRAVAGHQQKATRAWETSGGTVGWLGEWHTHPGGRASPSSIDRASWANVAKHTAKPMAFIILGENGIYVGVQIPGVELRENLTPIEVDYRGELFG